jgi:hypothetical protein
MSIDPVDDRRFWYTQEYYAASSPAGWQTRIGSFVIDTTPPTTTIDSGPSGLTNNANPSFTFHANEAGSTYQCKRDGPGGTVGVFAACTSPKAYTGLADGSYTFSVRATDPVGNVETTPPTRAFSVDTAPVHTFIDSGPTGTAAASYATFTFHSSKPSSTFECKRDGPGATTGAWIACTSPKMYTKIAGGSYVFSVRATDPASNVDATPPTQAWTVSAASYRDAVTATAGLLSYWRLGETSGTVAADQLLTNPGTYSGGVTLSEPGALAGDPDKAVRFDGSTGVVTVPTSATLDPNSITVELWARSDSATWNQTGWFVSKRNKFVLHPNAGSKNVDFYLQAGGGWQAVSYAPADVTIWHQYVGTYDATTGTQTLYVDGAAVASRTLAPGNLISSPADLTIGSDSGSLAARHGSGWVDDVAIYSSALSAATVGSHYAAH